MSRRQNTVTTERLNIQEIVDCTTNARGYTAPDAFTDFLADLEQHRIYNAPQTETGLLSRVGKHFTTTRQN